MNRVVYSHIKIIKIGYNQAGQSKKSTPAVVCKLTSPELKSRKVTVIASLKAKMIEKRELVNGFSYKFTGSDSLVDELSLFVKTERLCCAFLDFILRIKGDGSAAWLTVTGPKGTKHFISSEMEL
jgi:hypothetical protein